MRHFLGRVINITQRWLLRRERGQRDYSLPPAHPPARLPALFVAPRIEGCARTAQTCRSPSAVPSASRRNPLPAGSSRCSRILRGRNRREGQAQPRGQPDPPPASRPTGRSRRTKACRATAWPSRPDDDRSPFGQSPGPKRAGVSGRSHPLQVSRGHGCGHEHSAMGLRLRAAAGWRMGLRRRGTPGASG